VIDSDAFVKIETDTMPEVFLPGEDGVYVDLVTHTNYNVSQLTPGLWEVLS